MARRTVEASGFEVIRITGCGDLTSCSASNVRNAFKKAKPSIGVMRISHKTMAGRWPAIAFKALVPSPTVTTSEKPSASIIVATAPRINE